MKKIILIFYICISSTCFGQVKYNYFSKTELKQDLSFFSEKLTSIHPVFLDKTYKSNWKNQFTSIYSELKDSMTQNQFYLLVSPILAYLNDGHSNFTCPMDQRMQYMKSGGLSFPFSVEIKNNSIFITEYYGDDSTLFESGEEILQINGVSSSDMLGQMQKLIGGNSVATRNKVIAMNFRYYVWMIYGFEKNYELVIKNNLDKTVQLFVNGVTNEQFIKNRKRYPITMTELYSLSIDNKRKISILTIHSFADLENFCEFADSAFQKIAKNDIEDLVIDIRGNGGGRSVVVDSLMNYLTDKKYTQYSKIETRISNGLKEYYKKKYPERDWINNYSIDDLLVEKGQLIKPIETRSRFKRNLFLLTDNTTYSGAATFAGVFKELNMGSIIGEETGGTIGYYGDYWFMTMPNSGLQFYISPKWFVQYGGTDLNKGVLPDYLVSNKNNSIIDFTYKLIEKQRNANNVYTK